MMAEIYADISWPCIVRKYKRSLESRLTKVLTVSVLMLKIAENKSDVLSQKVTNGKRR